MFVFLEIWRALFSSYLRFEIHLFAVLPTSHWNPKGLFLKPVITFYFSIFLTQKDRTSSEAIFFCCSSRIFSYSANWLTSFCFVGIRSMMSSCKIATWRINTDQKHLKTIWYKKKYRKVSGLTHISCFYNKRSYLCM